MKTKHTYSHLLLALSFVIMIGGSVFAQTNLDTSFFPTENLQIWIDSFSRFNSYESIDRQDFQPYTSTKLGDDEHAYWLQFELANPQQDTLRYWLDVNVFDSLYLLYQIDNQWQRIERGLLIDYSHEERKLFQSTIINKYGFQLNIAPKNKITYYLRIKNMIRSESSIQGMSLQSIEQRQVTNSNRLVWFLIFSAMFFSIVLFLIIFSILQYLQNRDVAYSYYALYLSFVFLYYWWKFEKSNSFINICFTRLPEFYYYTEVPLWCMMYGTYMWFVIRFIDAKIHTPKAYQGLRFMGFLLFFYIFIDRLFIAVAGLSFAWDMLVLLRLVVIMICFFIVYLVAVSKHRLSVYILTGSLFMVIGGLYTMYLSITMPVHYFGAWDIPLLPIQIGILAEVFFFSTGLGYKSLLAEKEKTMITENLKQEEARAAFLTKRREQLNHWYTNISHEFRTPLTVIQGMAEQIRGNIEQQHLILKNSHQLLELVNQMLDLAKLESKHLKPDYQQGDIIRYLKYLTESFKNFARQREIDLSFHAEVVECWMDYDAQKIERILINLLHNAVKFTSVYGEIKVLVKKNNKALCLQVNDTGIGIAEAEIKYVFDRFYQTSHQHQKVEKGSGIGLALVQELVQLLEGTIEVESQLEKGTTFTICLPIQQKTKRQEAPVKSKILSVLSVSPTSNCLPIDAQSEQAIVLLIEDNEDVLYYLKDVLKTDYQLLIAKNGKIGIEVALKYIPDIIISDIMMPQMNGFAVCKYLKQDKRTSHIPIVLLTAKATIKDRIQGLSLGADAYLSKPFSQKELNVRIEQLIENRQRLQAHYGSGKIETVITNSSSHKEQEAIFLKELKATILQHIEQTDFDIPRLCQLMAMSKTQLYRKVKALTGKTVAMYVRSVRLQKAHELLQVEDTNVGSIALQIGIEDVSYFSRIFKQEFGYSPSRLKN